MTGGLLKLFIDSLKQLVESLVESLNQRSFSVNRFIVSASPQKALGPNLFLRNIITQIMHDIVVVTLSDTPHILGNCRSPLDSLYNGAGTP